MIKTLMVIFWWFQGMKLYLTPDDEDDDFEKFIAFSQGINPRW